ncbi:MAG TPA: hemerythrin domain-containing protein [Pseudonocardiaceae bacterium]|nr:hemerythrin domain-containing protein [Pseudonocardiaceae bacterium]
MRGWCAVNVIELLREDHEKVLIMLTELENVPAMVGADQSQARKELVTKLVIAESRHEAIEEQYFWPMVRESVPGGEELAHRAVEQEDAAKKLLAALDRAEPAQADFEPMVQRIVADGREHIDYEQTQVWPRVLASVDKSTLEELGEKMAKARSMAPTRPHPATPSGPGAQKTAGMAAAAADKLRDTLTGRGRS